VLAYKLVTEQAVWTVHLSTGIDSGQVIPDGTRLYMPTGELTPSGIWNILDTSDGAVIGTIQGGSGAHNTIASNDGRYVYHGGREYNYLDVYEHGERKSPRRRSARQHGEAVHSEWRKHARVHHGDRIRRIPSIEHRHRQSPLHSLLRPGAERLPPGAYRLVAAPKLAGRGGLGSAIGFQILA
jgi:hypothetical protein